jgi:DNA-binding MarR family transcriptional regulator
MNASMTLASLRPVIKYPDFSSRQLAVLLLLGEADKPMDFGAMCLNLQISKPALTRNIEGLVKLGMASRKRNSDDHRKVFIKIEPCGLILLQQMGMSA